MAGLEVPEFSEIDELIDRWQKRDGVEFQGGRARTFRSFSSVAPRVLASYGDCSSEFKAWLKDLPYHTFTIYESRNALQDDLYTAYYERLRALMMDAVYAFHDDSQIGGVAKQISQCLSETEIRPVQ